MKIRRACPLHHSNNCSTKLKLNVVRNVSETVLHQSPPAPPVDEADNTPPGIGDIRGWRSSSDSSDIRLSSQYLSCSIISFTISRTDYFGKELGVETVCYGLYGYYGLQIDFKESYVKL